MVTTQNGPAPNETVGGRPAQVNDYDDPAPMTMVRILPDGVDQHVARTHARAIEVAAGLRLGAVPDYSWVH